MSHFSGFVVSTNKKNKNEISEEDYNESVNCDYCQRLDMEKDMYEIKNDLVELLEGCFLPENVTVTDDGKTIRVRIAKGAIRPFVENMVKEVKSAVEKLTADHFYGFVENGVHNLHNIIDYVNPFTTIFIEFGKDWVDFDTYRRFFYYRMKENDTKDTTFYVVGAFDHHA